MNPIVITGFSVLALVAVLSLVAMRMASLDASRQRWQPVTSVLVVSERVGVGERLHGHVKIAEVPAGLAESSVTVLDDDARASHDLYPGEILRSERVELPQANRSATITVRLAQPTDAVKIGDVVDLWSVETGVPRAVKVVEQAKIVALGQQRLTVTVPAEQVAEVVQASLRPFVVSKVT